MNSQNGNTTVTPQIGHYEVTTSDQWGIQTHHVGKDKRCTCGGTARRPCRHIRAVADYLRAGGERAAEKHSSLPLREQGSLSSPTAVTPATCPICNAPVVREGRGRWRCPNDSSHYFQWRGEQGVRQFLTQRHPNKVGAFYEMTQEEHNAFLERATRRMYAGGYTPHS